jgi:hypothetical protein
MGNVLGPMQWWRDSVLRATEADVRGRDPLSQVYSEEAVTSLASVYARTCHTRASIVAGRRLDVSELPGVAGLLLADMPVRVGEVNDAARLRQLRPPSRLQTLNAMRTAIVGAHTECLSVAKRTEHYDFWLEQPFSRDLRTLETWFARARIMMRQMQAEMRSAR